jgi:RNA polymerase sigma factor (sigma-70 family)
MVAGDRFDVAADIAQEALVRLWEGRKPARSLRGYLFHITRNLALDHMKTKRTRRRLLRTHGPGDVRRPASPDQVLESEYVSDRVQRAIQDLPQRRREVFSLAYLQGLSYAEVGEIMGISAKTVKNQMASALAQLRQTLRPVFDERRAAEARPLDEAFHDMEAWSKRMFASADGQEGMAA